MNDYYSLLGVDRQATTVEIANAYRQILIRERQEKGAAADLGLYSQAYRTLTVPARRQEYDRLLDTIAGRYIIKNQEAPTEAERCYLAGLTCLEQKSYQDAVDYFSRAVQLEPEVSHFCSQLGLALGMFSDKLAEAERYCKKAIELDPDNPDFFFNLGFLYQRHNLVEAAQSAFDQANEAIKKREKRILGEGQPLITPWNEKGQSLMEELAIIENMVQEMGPEAGEHEAGPESAEPQELKSVAAAEATTSEDLLREISEIESRMAKIIPGDQSPARPEDIMPSPQETVPLEAAEWSFDDGDLLKELDLLEAQVKGVEELHNGVLEEESEIFMPLVGETSQNVKAEETLKSPDFILPQEYKTAENFSLTEEKIPFPETVSSLATATEGETDLSKMESTPPLFPPAPEAQAGIEELVLPEVLRVEEVAQRQEERAEALPVRTEEGTLPSVSAMAQSSVESDMKMPAGESSWAEIPEPRMEAMGTGFPSLPAREKLKMLEELEREMMSELDRLRMEKQKLMSAMDERFSR